MQVSPRTRRIGLLLALALAAAALLLPLLVERRVRARLERAGSLRVSVASVRFSWLGPLALEGLGIELPGQGRLRVRRVLLDWSWRGGLLRRVVIEDAVAEASDLTLTFAASAWTVAAEGEEVRLSEAGGRGELWLRRQPPQVVTVTAARLEVGALVRVTWKGQAVIEAGRWSGTGRVAWDGDRLESAGAVMGEAVRIALFPPAGSEGPAQQGEPTVVRLAWDTSREGGRLEVRRWRAALGGAEANGRGTLTGEGGALRLEVELSARADLARGLATAGLGLPAPFASLPRDDLGIAALELVLRGDPDDPGSLQVSSRLAFQPPKARVTALDFLRGPFEYAATSEGRSTTLEVREGAPGFVPLDEVPPLLIRTLLLAEDASFFNHRGVEPAEVPIAWATNRARGLPSRGASTITQQLVKNLFLSREKRLGRKLQEVVLALLLETALTKQRILEIYLNVIEWGPGLFGVGPAARHYFGKSPSALTPREMAFLVCLIPSPVRYHEAHAAGVGEGLQRLVDNLLAKLRSVDALDEDEYQRALEPTLDFAPEPQP